MIWNQKLANGLALLISLVTLAAPASAYVDDCAKGADAGSTVATSAQLPWIYNGGGCIGAVGGPSDPVDAYKVPIQPGNLTNTLQTEVCLWQTTGTVDLLFDSPLTIGGPVLVASQGSGPNGVCATFTDTQATVLGGTWYLVIEPHTQDTDYEVFYSV